MVSPFLKQAWTASGSLLNMVGQGMLLSYPSSLLPALRAPDSPIKVDLDTASWLSSSVGLAGIPGFLMSSVLMERYGRKIAHSICILPGIIGWLMVYFGTNVTTLMIGRILGGVTAGSTVSLGAIVIGEYTSPAHRGMFLNLKTAAVCLGGMIVHILANFVSWRTVAMIALIPHIVAFSIICTWVESPSWLASKRQFEKSEQAFLWLRGNNEKSRREIQELIRAQKEQLTEGDGKKSFSESVRGFFKKFTRKDFQKPMFIIFISSILIESSGRHIFPAYATQIIGSITGEKTKSFYFTLCIDLIITGSATFSSILANMMKRRTLLFTTGFAAVTVLIANCIYLYLMSINVVSNDHTWVPLAVFSVYFILANLGCTPIPMALLGEIYPLAHRSVGSAVSGFTLSVALMIGLQVAPYLLESVKVYGTFAVLGGLSGFALLVMFFILPETKDRTLQEIEDYFNFGKFRDNETVESDDKDVKMKMLS